MSIEDTTPVVEQFLETIPVRVVGEVTVAATVEIEAEHADCMTFAGSAAAPPVQILQLDPLRKRAVLLFTGVGNGFICHSLQQAFDQIKQGTTPVSAPVTVGSNFVYESTAPLWFVGVSTLFVSVIAERRGSA